MFKNIHIHDLVSERWNSIEKNEFYIVRISFINNINLFSENRNQMFIFLILTSITLYENKKV